MANDGADGTSRGPVPFGGAGRFLVDAARPYADAGGGLPAFAATDLRSGRDDLIAVQIARDAPARGWPVSTLTNQTVRNLMVPVGTCIAPGADGVPQAFVICPAPPGPPLLSRLHPWPETELIRWVLKPVAAVLVILREARVTHRAIRPDNLFQAADGGPVVLGCAWASPPASLQPALFEPPPSAMCHRLGRGDGSVADDVYALGVLLLTLLLGRLPLAGLDETEILRRKLDMGSHAALTEGERLSPLALDLTRGMLAEDPDHRTPPELLADPPAARSRRVATRPPRRAQRSLEIGTETVWHARGLALACTRQPVAALQALRQGSVDRWLRRGLGDAMLASQIDDFVRQRAADNAGSSGVADGLLVMRSVAVLDPLAPLVWQGLTMWPDGIGPLLLDEAASGSLLDMMANEAVATWAGLRPERCDAPFARIEARRLRAISRPGRGRGDLQLRYALNALLPLGGPMAAGACVVGVAELLPLLEQQAGRMDRSTTGPLDMHLLAFIGARLDHVLETEIAAVGDPKTEFAAIRGQIRICTLLQQRNGPASLPQLAAWLVQAARPLLATWPNLMRREAAEQALVLVQARGWLPELRDLLDDPVSDGQDALALEKVRERASQIDAELAALDAWAPARAARAQQIGQRLATVAGLAALVGSIIIAVL
jgi:hypothetical protein